MEVIYHHDPHRNFGDDLNAVLWRHILPPRVLDSDRIVLVGIGSIILDRAVIEPQVLIGAGSLVPPGKRLASGFLYLGNPVKQIRALTAAEIAYFRYSAEHYWRLAQQHRASLEN